MDGTQKPCLWSSMKQHKSLETALNLKVQRVETSVGIAKQIFLFVTRTLLRFASV